MPNGRRKSKHTRAANQRRMRQAGQSTTPPTTTATTAADPLSPADIAKLFCKALVEGNPTVPLSLTVSNTPDVAREIRKICEWDCTARTLLDGLTKLTDDGAPKEVLGAVCARGVQFTVATGIQNAVVAGRVGDDIFNLTADLQSSLPDAWIDQLCEAILVRGEGWECSKQHILDMLPALEDEIGMHKDLVDALRDTAYCHTIDGNADYINIVHDPASVACQTNKLLVHGSVTPGGAFDTWVVAVQNLLADDVFSADDLAASIEVFSDWGGTEADAMRFLQSMRTADVPVPIVEAFRASACTSTTVASPEEQQALGLQCGGSGAAVPDIEPASWEGLQPEPQPTECSTCCHPFSKDDLFGCDTSQCEYRQCATCILKGKGGVCTTPGCLKLHWDCPACTEPAGDDAGLELTDVRFSKADVLLALDGCRRQFARANDDAVTAMDIAMTSFVREMTTVRRGL